MYDILLWGGRVVDVHTRTSRIANLAIKDGRIACISGTDLPAGRVVDCRGLVVSPGFIDPHGHLDGHIYAGRLSALQGITTTIGGNCGLSPLDLPEFFAAQQKQGYPIHQAEMIGHSFTLRRAVGIEDENVPATPSQVQEMERLARKGLEAGACGVSLGLDYSPGAGEEEILAMSRLAAEYGRTLPVHTRLFTQNDLYSLYEMFSASKKTGARVLLSHFVYQYSGFGTMEPALEAVDRARASGLDIWMDTGMYTPWATYVGTATFAPETIKDLALRFGDMVVATGKYTGQTLNEELYYLLRRKYPNESVICFTGCDDEVDAAIRKPYAMPSTDAAGYRQGEGHPQIAGSFPKYLCRVLRQKKELSLEETVYKATLLPARTLGLPEGFGTLDEGALADITIFDPETVEDKAAFPHLGDPDAPPVGIPYVLVAGELAVDNGQITQSRSGKIIRYTKQGHQVL